MKNNGDKSLSKTVSEVRRIRAAISEEHGNDVGKLCDYLRSIEHEFADRLVRSPESVSTSGVAGKGT